MHYAQSSPEIHQDLNAFFAILNDPLRKQILYHLHSALIKKVVFFQKCSSVEHCFFICKLKSVLFLPLDYIIREGEQGDRLYFINKGEASVLIRIDPTQNACSAKEGKAKSNSEDLASSCEQGKKNKQKVIAFLKDG